MDLDGFLGLPVGSITLVESSDFSSTVFQRTGVGGWMITRSINLHDGMKKMEGGRYHDEPDIREFLEERTNLRFHVLSYGIRTVVDDPRPSVTRVPRADQHQFVRFGAGADYRHACAECNEPRRHPIHGLEPGQEREPVILSGGDDLPSVQSVLSCYGALMDTLDEYNEMVEEDDRVMLPYTLQTVIAAYIEEQEAIQSLKEGK